MYNFFFTTFRQVFCKYESARRSGAHEFEPGPRSGQAHQNKHSSPPRAQPHDLVIQKPKRFEPSDLAPQLSCFIGTVAFLCFRVTLNEGQAVEIYLHKVSSTARFNDISHHAVTIALRIDNAHLSKKYGITTRATRDIWNRRSWAYATNHMWKYEKVGTNSVEIAELSKPRVLHM